MLLGCCVNSLLHSELDTSIISYQLIVIHYTAIDHTQYEPSRNTKEGLKGSIMLALELDGNLLQYDDE